MSNIQIGEKNAYEYAWSRNIHELITQLYFQITDTYSYNQIYVIKTIFHKIIKICYENLNVDIYYYYNLLNCYKLILNTRNITYGKGLHHISYVLLGVHVESTKRTMDGTRAWNEQLNWPRSRQWPID